MREWRVFGDVLGVVGGSQVDNVAFAVIIFVPQVCKANHLFTRRVNHSFIASIIPSYILSFPPTWFSTLLRARTGIMSTMKHSCRLLSQTKSRCSQTIWRDRVHCTGVLASVHTINTCECFHVKDFLFHFFFFLCAANDLRITKTATSISFGISPRMRSLQSVALRG